MRSTHETPSSRFLAAGPTPLALTLLTFAATQPAAAQEAPPDTTSADSLAREIDRLRARMDSLAAELDRLREDPAAADEAGELGALREAAREAAETASRDTSRESEGSRTRNLNRLNPEISLTGDIVGVFTDPVDDGSDVRAVPREFELSIQSALDPYSRAKVFISHHEDVGIAGTPAFAHGHGPEDDEEGHDEEEAGELEIEEGYIQWVGLPGGLGAKAGKFRQEIGLYNRWHDHALLEVQRPLPVLALLGEDGLSQTGAGLALPSVTTGAGTQTSFFQVATGTNEALFEGGAEFSYLGRLESFWDLSPSSFVQFGATGVYGENDGASLVTRLLELDAYFRWKPVGRGLYRDFTAKTEWYVVEKEERDALETARGGYLQLNYKASRRWTLGARADYLEPFGEEDDEIVQLVPSITWWQSEWVRFRFQYNHLRRHDRGNHTLILQSVWAVGPHKHETY